MPPSGKAFICTEILEEWTLWFKCSYMAHIYTMGLGSVDVFMRVEENFTLIMPCVVALY